MIGFVVTGFRCTAGKAVNGRSGLKSRAALSKTLYLSMSCLSISHMLHQYLTKVGVAQTVFLVNRVFVPCQKEAVLTKMAKMMNPLKARALLLEPLKTTKMTKMAGVTQEKPGTAKLRIWTLRFWVFRAQDCLPRDRCSVGTRHAFFPIILVCI